MKIQLRKYEKGCTICAYDAQGTCHINKVIDKEEFDSVLIYYFDCGYDVKMVDDQGQSEELYELELP